MPEMPGKITITISAASLLAVLALIFGANAWANQIEARVAVIETHNRLLIARLDRIENKLDRMMQWRSFDRLDD